MLNKEKKHLKVLLSSIKKVYNKAVINGKLEIKDVYYLNIIFNLLNKLELTFEETKMLEAYYNKLSNYSDNICKPDMIKTYYTPKKKFVQATKEHCDNVPLPDYTVKECIKLVSMDAAYGGLTEVDLNVTINFKTCEGVDVTINHLLQPGTSSETLQINQCITPNTLFINGILVVDYNQMISFDLLENRVWDVIFSIDSCVQIS